MRLHLSGPGAGNNEHGFTMVEIAIVMVVIGLLIGVVLKGQALIQNARYKSLINQANELTNAYFAYLNQYGKYPGDDNTAVGRWGATTADGNNNGRIDNAEPLRANQHLALASLIAGTYNGTTQTILLKYGNATTATLTQAPAAMQALCANVINFAGLDGEAAQALDSALDDGVYSTGKVRGDAAYTAGTVIANTNLCL